jgi:hypothetical protein
MGFLKVFEEKEIKEKDFNSLSIDIANASSPALHLPLGSCNKSDETHNHLFG